MTRTTFPSNMDSEMKLVYRSNSCPICLICIECAKVYGSSCSCESKEIYWDKNSKYSVDFRHKLLTNSSTNNRMRLDQMFVLWFFEKVSSQIKIPENQSDVNICRKCLSKFDRFKKGLFKVLIKFYLSIILKILT